MAYRTSARAQPGDTAVCCVRCGSLTSIAFAAKRHDDFACTTCGHDQPVLPKEVGEVRALSLKDYETTYRGDYEELTPFAKELGKDVKTSALDLVVDGIDCKIGLNINSGSVMGLDHHAATTGLPAMQLLTEKPEHVYAKERGVIKEVQTGDAAFDDAVYIESNASDDDVLTVLASPVVRKAILVLLRDTGAILISGQGVAFYSSKDNGPFEPKGIRERLRWLRVLAGAPRPLVNEVVVEPARGRIVKMVFGWSCPVGLFLFILGLAKWTPNDGGPVVGCLVAGVFIAIVMLPIWTILLRGRSTSHREILSWRITTFIFAPLIVGGVLLTFNGAFDGSQERIVKMKIVSVSKDDEDSSYHARTNDEQGGSHSYSFKSQPKEGQFVRVGWKEGALGWTWESGDPSVVEATTP